MQKIILFLLTLSSLSLFAQPTSSVSSHLHIDQFGYQPNTTKVAVLSNPMIGYNNADSYTPGTTLQVREWFSGNVMFSANVTPWNGGATHVQSGDQVWWFDFSNFNTQGYFYLYDPTNDLRSYQFQIADDIYLPVLKEALRVFYYQRCNLAKVAPYAETGWTDGAAFSGTEQDLDCRLVSNPTLANSKDLSGGWFDAGDYNKYINFADGAIHDLLSAYEYNDVIWTDNFNLPESGNGIPDLLDEIKWELDWFLKMQNSDGSVLHKVSNLTYNNASPPSADTEIRRYAPSTISATISAAGAFAHAAIVFKSLSDPTMQAYGNTLETAAINAWNNQSALGGYSYYNNAGFLNAAAEDSEYQQLANRFAAAAYLFALTGNATYKTFVDNNWSNIHLNQWTFAFAFETEYQDAALYYANTVGATTSIANDIKAKYLNSMTNSAGNLPAYNSNLDAYRAYMTDDNHTWGNNRDKARKGGLFANIIGFQLDPTNDALYQEITNGYLHYLHGVNPQNLVYLTNMGSHGAENSAKEIYHNWFTNGSALWDRVGVSTYGPAPGFVPGGVNKNFSPDASYSGPTLSPPQNQPILKSYKEWNTSFPENSWEITEPSITYQAAYVKLLAQVIPEVTFLPIELISFSAKKINRQAQLDWIASETEITAYYEVEHSTDGITFKSLDRINYDASHRYLFTHKQPTNGNNYYRLKHVDFEGKIDYSDIKILFFEKEEIDIFPNPFANEIQVNIKDFDQENWTLTIRNIEGKVMQVSTVIEGESILVNAQIGSGVFFIELNNGSTFFTKKMVRN